MKHFFFGSRTSLPFIKARDALFYLFTSSSACLSFSLSHSLTVIYTCTYTITHTCVSTLIHTRTVSFAESIIHTYMDLHLHALSHTYALSHTHSHSHAHSHLFTVTLEHLQSNEHTKQKFKP